MGQRHDSTPAQRAQAVCHMIAHAGDYGVVTHLSHEWGVSRQTLYTWMERGWQAVEAAFLPPLAAPIVTPALHRHHAVWPETARNHHANRSSRS